MKESAQHIYHVPVMCEEVCRLLVTRPDGVYVDCTYGGGGHSMAILKRLSPKGKLICIEKDLDSPVHLIDDPRVFPIRGDFRHVANYLEFLGLGKATGILADLGLSWHQLDTVERGFSFRREGALDMRIHKHQELSAQVFLAQTSEEELEYVLRQYGELPHSRQVARRIIQQRNQRPLFTSTDLKDALEGLTLRGSHEKLLACVFQAIRIHVNGELEALRKLLQSVPEILEPEGRVAIISYHSLEDRLVKNFFRTGDFEGKVRSDAYGRVLRPLEPLMPELIRPTEEEKAQNSRARSARLRVAIKPVSAYDESPGN
ncbi:MAG: 16S rRNA (cytosine(1402)-N(4))-methyltransferase RsmH [Flavobacteriales bacterium]|nr:16S rRNA (cytosine(1402)-N(4))-methyltransferase RsmH [Flavobacteriales bacterium]